MIVKLATVVKGDLKVPFLIATTPRCRGGRYSFLCIALLYPWSVPFDFLEFVDFLTLQGNFYARLTFEQIENWSSDFLEK